MLLMVRQDEKMYTVLGGVLTFYSHFESVASLRSFTEKIMRFKALLVTMHVWTSTNYFYRNKDRSLLV